MKYCYNNEGERLDTKTGKGSRGQQRLNKSHFPETEKACGLLNFNSRYHLLPKQRLG
jgi:hypothetical protein